MRNNPGKSYLMEGRILFDRGRVKLAPPTSTLLLTILFIFLFSPLFIFSTRGENDTVVNVMKKNTFQDGMVEEEGAKKFSADMIDPKGEAPAKVICIYKKFTPPKDYSFRPFRPQEGNEVFFQQVKIAIHHREDPDNRIPWKFWAFNSVEKRPKFVDIWFDPESFGGIGVTPIFLYYRFAIIHS